MQYQIIKKNPASVPLPVSSCTFTYNFTFFFGQFSFMSA